MIDKIGFEVKLNEKRDEFALINRELNNSRQNLLFALLCCIISCSANQIYSS